MPPNLDDYLTELGISQQGESAAPAAPMPTMPSHPPQGFGPQAPEAAFEQFMQRAVRYLGDFAVKVRRNDSDGAQVLEAEILGENAGRLAGQDGQVLHALETLAYAVLSKRGGPTDIKLRVDAGGYRQRQTDTLSALAQRLAAQVAKTGEAHTLQPMTPTERRIIHMSLKDHPLVTTVSEGEGKGRHLVITPRQ